MFRYHILHATRWIEKFALRVEVRRIVCFTIICQVYDDLSWEERIETAHQRILVFDIGVMGQGSSICSRVEALNPCLNFSVLVISK